MCVKKDENCNINIVIVSAPNLKPNNFNKVFKFAGKMDGIIFVHSKSNPDKLKIVERLHVTVKLIKILPWVWIGFQDKMKYDSDEKLEENIQFDWKEYSIKIYYQQNFWEENSELIFNDLIDQILIQKYQAC